jgi:vitamin B12 transporter
VEKSSNRFTPSFGISYLPTSWLKLRATVASSFKMPEPITNMSYRSGNTTYLANPDINPEHSVGWEIGGDIFWNEITAGITYFSVDYKDKIESQVLQITSEIRQYQNLPGRTEYRGLEFNASWDIGEFFDWDFSLKPYVSLTKMFRFFNTEKKKQTGYVQDLNVSYGIEFDQPSIGLHASFDVSYFGHQFPHYTTAQVEFGGDTIMNFHLTKRIYEWEDKGSLILKLDITNLNDRFYEPQRNYPESGRSFSFGIRYEY